MKLHQIFEERDPFDSALPPEVTELIVQIKAECGPFIREGVPLWRGLPKRIDKPLLFTQDAVVNRQPRNTDVELHKIFDRVLEPLVGFKPRSEALFCSTDRSATAFYGAPYLVFPKGEYESLFLHDVTDLYAQADWMFKDGGDTTDEEAHDILEPLIRMNNLRAAKTEDEAPEVMVHDTNGFFIVNFKKLEELLEFISEREITELFFGKSRALKKTMARTPGNEDDDDF